MGILSLLLGMIALVASLIPGCSYLFMLVCCVGVAAGVVALNSPKCEDRGVPITGIVFSSFAAILILMWMALFGAGTIDAADEAAATAETAAIVNAMPNIPDHTPAAPVAPAAPVNAPQQ